MDRLNDLFDQLRLTWALLRDGRVPLWTKSIPVVVLAYVISPLDLIPVIPVIGWLDDIAVVVFGLQFFERMVPEYLVVEHRAKLGLNALVDKVKDKR